LIQAIRDDDPVIFLESKFLYGMEGEVPDEAYSVPFGEANVLRDGEDLTIVALGAMAPRALDTAEALAKAGYDVEVIDPRTTSPLDEETILESVARTGRLVVVDESPPRCSLAADIASMVAEKGFRSLKAPIRKVTCPHTPVPFSPSLEDAYMPSAARIEVAARETLGYS
jgi:pyruvate dehydrogenase E1 component beta subunit